MRVWCLDSRPGCWGRGCAVACATNPYRQRLLFGGDVCACGTDGFGRRELNQSAVFKRLRSAEEWLRRMAGQMRCSLGIVKPKVAQPVRVRVARRSRERMEGLNRQLEGWGSYFSVGYPREAYRDINWHLGYRLANHLQHHRSQRPYQLPEGVSLYEHLQRLGLKFLRIKSAKASA